MLTRGECFPDASVSFVLQVSGMELISQVVQCGKFHDLPIIGEATSAVACNCLADDARRPKPDSSEPVQLADRLESKRRFFVLCSHLCGWCAVMSSESREEVVSQALEAGASEYLVKPIRRRELSNLWQRVHQPSPSSTGTIQICNARTGILLQLAN